MVMGAAALTAAAALGRREAEVLAGGLSSGAAALDAVSIDVSEVIAAGGPEDAKEKEVGGRRSHGEPRVRRGGMDITFLVTADTHFGYSWARVPTPGAPAGLGIEEVNANAVRAMNTIEGTPYPAALGGAVGAPRGVLVAGDLTEGGWANEWSQFEAMFGLTGREGQLRYPVYEGAGNHDKHSGGHVEEQIKRRHGGARYSWDWHDLHVVCLGEAPNDADLEWLRGDLAAVGKDLGVVLYFHIPLAGPYSKGNWFGDGDYADKLHKILEGHRVLGIFNGHFHASGHYRWRGYDAYLVGSPKHSWHSFVVARVTDDRMSVASYNYDQRSFWWWHQKPVFGARGGEARWFAEGAALVGRPPALAKAAAPPN